MEGIPLTGDRRAPIAGFEVSTGRPLSPRHNGSTRWRWALLGEDGRVIGGGTFWRCTLQDAIEAICRGR